MRQGELLFMGTTRTEKPLFSPVPPVSCRRASLSVLVASVAALIGALALPQRTVFAQVADTTRGDSTFDIRSLWRDRGDRTVLTITSGKAYNRVEGLPIMIGPTFRGKVGQAAVSVGVLGIIRTAHSAHWDSENLGHRVTAEVRSGGQRGYSVGGTSFDIVAPIERWQLPEPDAGLAAFLFKRDYLDYFGQHGANLFATAFAGDYATLRVSYGNERWSSRRARDVPALLRGSRGWRINPPVDDGTMHIFETRFALDSRNAELNPWAGWYVDARYEYGAGNLTSPAVVTPATNPQLRGDEPPGPVQASYGRVFFDVRKYNRISPVTQLNARLVIGGWLHGDPLPLERRFSVGGVGTIPGFDFRRTGIGTDVGQCATAGNALPGRPAMCERVALAQLEYRKELHADLVDMFNRNGIRVRGSVFTVRPSAVAFVDAGRGWLVGERLGTLRYPSGSLPPFDTYRADAGVGLDLGVVGIYVAKAVSSTEEPANFFVRIHNRF